MAAKDDEDNIMPQGGRFTYKSIQLSKDLSLCFDVSCFFITLYRKIIMIKRFILSIFTYLIALQVIE